MPGISATSWKYRLRFPAHAGQRHRRPSPWRHTGPMRRRFPCAAGGAFPLGDGVGGAGTALERRPPGATYRPNSSALASRTALTAPESHPADLTIQDWASPMTSSNPISRNSKNCAATSGKAGNLRGQIVDGGNPFEGPRVSDYPKQAADHVASRDHFHRGGEEAWLITPFPTAPHRTTARPTPTSKVRRWVPANIGGHCEYFGCESNSKASPNILHHAGADGDSRFELRPMPM